jgi:trehalose 6-phosphate phosphatase
MTTGKLVMEVRPAMPWTKGDAILRLLSDARYAGMLPVFIGDDRTDEDAFKALQNSGITVKVTENPRARSEAKYYIHSSEEVFDLLRQLIAVRKVNLERNHP